MSELLGRSTSTNFFERKAYFFSGALDGYSALIIVTRGCPSMCFYCAAYKINGKSIRARSATSVLEEIDLLYNKYNVRHLFFLDTRFTHNVDTTAEICEGILRNRV